MTVTQNLERHYDLFANATAPWEFFNGLASYVRYVLETPALKAIFDGEMKKRDEVYRTLDELEEKSVVELRTVKRKLLAIIKRHKVDPSELKRYSTIMPMPNEGQRTLLDDMESFDSGKGIQISGFHSDNLQHYLFDIAVNLLRLGHKDEIKDFILPTKEYGRYLDEINGDTMGDLQFGDNTHGNFVFSKETWPKRCSQVLAIKRERKLEPWGAFETLLEFWKGRTAALKNETSRQIIENHLNDKEYYFSAHDGSTYYVMSAANDIQSLTAGFMENQHEIRFLKVQNFKIHVKTAHSFLLQRIAESPMAENKTEESRAEVRSKFKFASQTGTLRFGDIAHSFQRGLRGEENRVLIFRKLWEARRVVKRGITTIEGTPMTPAYLAVQLNLTSDASTFNRNKAAKDKLSTLIKGINRILRNKKFPALIERKGGIQLVVVEK